jgi:Family of unknown function (DUF6049)
MRSARALQFVVGALGALLSLAAVAPSSAQGLRQSDASGAVRLALVSQNLWIAPNGRLDVTVHLDQQAPTGSEIAVVIYQRLRSRSLFQASLDGELGSSLATISRPVGDLPRDARGNIVVSVALSDTNQANRTRLRVDGVYPVRIELRNEDGDEIDGFTTDLVRTTDVVGAKPLSVSMIVSLAAAPALAPDGTSQIADEDHSALTTLIAALAAHPTVPLTIVPRPETLTALDASTSTEDRRLLDSLRQSIGNREVVAGPYVAVDPAAMLRDGLANELTTQLRTGSDTLAQVLAPARPDGRTWIADASLDASGLRGLRDAGVDQVVLREDLLTPTDLPFTLTRPAVLTTDDVTVPSTSFIDGGLARHFDEPSDPVLAATHLLADLSQLYFDSPSVQRGTVLAPPTDWTPSAAFLDTLLDGLASSPMLTPVTIDDYFRTVPRAVDDDGHPVVRSLAEPSTASLGSYGPALTRTRQRLTGFSTMVDETDPLLDSAQHRLLVASADDLTSDRRAAYLGAVDAEINQQTSFLRAPARQSVTLTSRSATVPLTIRSNSPTPLRVRVLLTSPKLDFPDGAAQIVTLDDVNTTVTFKVKARASGTFPLDVQVTSPDGTLPIATERLTVRSTAVSGVGFVLSIGAGLFLAGWWIHHLRSERRLRRRKARPGHPSSPAPAI